jgi:flagellar motor switch protein FliM
VSKILTQEEIDALLSSAAALRTGGPRAGQGGAVSAYDFRRPDRVSKDQIRSLHFLHDRFAGNVGTSLSAFLRTVTDVSITSVEQFTYAEFLMSLPDPTAFYAISMAPLEGLAALELHPTVAFTMIDRMLGGSGRGLTVTRALTEIEQNVVDDIVKLILENLADTWRGIVDVQFRVSGRETRPQMLQVAAPNEVVVLLGFDVRIGDARGMLNICIPASAIELGGGRFSQTWHRARREPSARERRNLHDNLARVPMDVTAALDTSLHVRELLRLRPGDVLSLGRPVREPLDVRVRGATKLQGRLVTAGGRVGVRLEPSGLVARESEA